ncbi:hypothetical protein C5167_021523 [Papaver somniferum]|nr:hypothetical protein C5167_021523 [Papaver somniferum]
MAVVALTSRIWNPNAPLPYPFSADTRAVQEDLLSRIRITLNRERIGSDIEEELRNLLAPVSCFKQALTRWLFEFLMECSEIRQIPKSLKKAIAIIIDPEKQPVPRSKRASNDKMEGSGQKAKKPIKSRNKVQGSAKKKKKEDTADAPTIEEVLI